MPLAERRDKLQAKRQSDDSSSEEEGTASPKDHNASINNLKKSYEQVQARLDAKGLNKQSHAGHPTAGANLQDRIRKAQEKQGDAYEENSPRNPLKDRNGPDTQGLFSQDRDRAHQDARHRIQA